MFDSHDFSELRFKKILLVTHSSDYKNFMFKFTRGKSNANRLKGGVIR